MQSLTDPLFAHLLLKHKTIVLPEIGTITLNETPASTVRMGRDFQPPRCTVSFQQHESKENRLQDILLKESSFFGSGLQDSEAAEIGNNYVVGIKFQLEKSNSYHFLGIGTLKVNDSGRLHFEAEENSFNFGLPEFTTNVITKSVATPPVTKPKHRRKRVPVWFILLLLLIGGGTTAWFVFPEKIIPLWNQAISFFEKTEVVTDTTQNQTTDTTENIMVVPDTTVQDTAVTDTLIDESPISFFVIAGSFVDKPEAENYCSMLRQKGYSKAVVLTSSTDSRIRVAYQGFSSRETAIEFLNKTKITESKNDIWLLNQN